MVSQCDFYWFLVSFLNIMFTVLLVEKVSPLSTVHACNLLVNSLQIYEIYERCDLHFMVTMHPIRNIKKNFKMHFYLTLFIVIRKLSNKNNNIYLNLCDKELFFLKCHLMYFIIVLCNTLYRALIVLYLWSSDLHQAVRTD